MADEYIEQDTSVDTDCQVDLLGKYFDTLKAIVGIALAQDIEIQSLIYDPGNHIEIVQRAIDLRRKFICDADETKCKGHLNFDYFGDISTLDKVASWTVVFEASDEFKKASYRRACEEYKKDHTLFLGDPDLYDCIRKKEETGQPDFELIDIASVDFSGVPNEVVKTTKGFSRLCSDLDARIVRNSRAKWPSARTFIRLDPHFFSTDQPSARFQEDRIVPANPKWFSDENLGNGDRDYGRYELLERSMTSENFHSHWEREVKDVRSLEFHARRSEPGYLSMMIEELPKSDDSSGLMVGRCIHLDTTDPMTVKPSEATIKHLDLAINVYEDGVRQERLENTLEHGKSAKASFRTHLLRIEGIPFFSVFEFCYMFFNSKCLLKEMMEGLGVELLDELSNLKCGQSSDPLSH